MLYKHNRESYGSRLVERCGKNALSLPYGKKKVSTLAGEIEIRRHMKIKCMRVRGRDAWGEAYFLPPSCAPVLNLLIRHFSTSYNQIQPEYGDEQADAGRDG